MKILSDAEFKAAVWGKIKAHLTERLEGLRVSNDNELSADRTARLRGRIAELKYLLALEDDNPPNPAIDADADY